ncbi:hypothetical protein BGZ80_010200 [Entomortierella chlamydospora]|uniref:N-acetyltransferase domain-containing protein n=1 Tax=Entomortierella chlamydospora TaxID=101097 RepID=A0A9P6MW01_9FUNG|nr:hypothetical protein BGZ79_009242 [Entomortierella chlamydospora]KAG0014834.1 hypothetical protein BGZ80_010200 [Entomortierella chlamydospora]
MQAEQDTPFVREKATAMGPYLVSDAPPHYLSAVEFSDIPEMVRVVNINKDIFNGTASFQYPYTEDHAHARISRAVGYTTNLGYNTHWVMRTSPDGPLIGWIHAYFNTKVNEVHPETGRPLKICEIGYWVSPEYVGKGYGSRSAQFVTHEIMFKEFGCDIVRADAFVDNKGSRTILENIGMVCEVESITEFIPKFQEQRVICCYAVHRSEATQTIKARP